MKNFKVLEKELAWIDRLIQDRISSYFHKEELADDSRDFELTKSYYSDFIKNNELTFDEQKVLALALSTHLAPDILDIFLTKNKLYDSAFTEFGGLTNENYNAFVPTIQTAIFLLVGEDKENYLNVLSLFSDSSTLYAKSILTRDETKENELHLVHTKLTLSKSSLNFILYGEELSHEYSQNFPASELKTGYEWEDLVLTDYTQEHLNELDIWLVHSHTLLEEWGMAKSVGRGYKALFYGSSGTGKTLTATLLGKKFNKKVYRVDLSQLVSKYIGETEKNLEKVFKSAEDKDWILFFDEADSLFSKRTEVSSSNDKHANQETAYLLQRIETCENLIILASNLKDNFDDAFLRRFQSIIYFPLPDEAERLLLWKKGFSPKANLSQLNLEEIAYKYELSGANIMNVIRLVSLLTINRGSDVIEMDDIILAIRREKYKEGKIV